MTLLRCYYIAFLLGLSISALCGIASADEPKPATEATTAAQTPIPAGIYVQKTEHFYRTEFAPGGRCYYNYYHGGGGTYSVEKDEIVCLYGDEEHSRYRWKGKNLVDQDGNEWLPREELLKMPWKDVRPVTLVVLDSDTRKPIKKFSYQYSLDTAGEEYDPLWARPLAVDSADGTITFDAPESCKITLWIKGKDIIGGYGSYRGYDLKADNMARRIEVLVSIGATFFGTVVDAKTGKPIAGALVAPIVFTPPLFTPDGERAVKTDAEGKFHLQGVDSTMGIHVSHPDYYEFNHGGFEKAGRSVVKGLFEAHIKLESGEKIFGVVKDAAGKPLAGVKVSDGAGKGCKTKAKGSFVLMSPRKWGGDDTYNLDFEKDGYLRQELHPTAADPKGLSIVLQLQPVLDGQVFGPDNRPVKIFEIAAGIGIEPPTWKCTHKKVDQPEGRFSLRVVTDRDYDHEGKVWISVKAPGFAPWETVVDVWTGTKSVVAKLSPGVTVHGTIDVAKAGQRAVEVTLLPSRLPVKGIRTNDTAQKQEFGRQKTAVGKDGTFQFEHVAPGSYMLAIAGQTISPIGASIVVADADVDAGRFSPRGTGTIEGLIYEHKMICEGGKCRLDEKRGPWAFAGGHISFQDTAGRADTDEFPHLKNIPFKADEHGRFRVEGVPAGMVSVNIPYHETADIINSHVRTAKVIEGKTTEVRFFDTSNDWNATCRFVVGDGSPAQFATGSGMSVQRAVNRVKDTTPGFNVQLQPIAETPLSFGLDDRGLDEKHQLSLRDVQPGLYRLTVSDWRVTGNFEGNCYEGDVDIKSGGTPLIIPLGAGSVAGAVEWSKDYRYMIHVLAVGKRTHTIRHARCDDTGNFCVCYLPEDEYTLWAHDYDAGWCKIAEVAVKNDIVDIGSHKLVPGGTIAGLVPPKLAIDKTVVVTATDQNGIAIEHPNHFDPIGTKYTISNLWPGRWTVRMKQGEKLLAEKVVELKGTETATCDLLEK